MNTLTLTLAAIIAFGSGSVALAVFAVLGDRQRKRGPVRRAISSALGESRRMVVTVHAPAPYTFRVSVGYRVYGFRTFRDFAWWLDVIAPYLTGPDASARLSAYQPGQLSDDHAVQLSHPSLG